jgi:VanZ family protein
MRKLWIAFVLLATYVSIYPFNFQFRSVSAETLRAFVESWRHMTSRGDILGNVVLFVPFGILGMLAAKPGKQNLRRLLYVCLLGTVFAFVLQVAQLYLPSRDQALQDVFWNLLGTVGGATLGMIAGGYLLSSAARARSAVGSLGIDR